MNLENLSRILRPIRARLNMLVARGRVGSIDDSSSIQKVKADFLADETIDKLDRIQNYGFTSVPKSGAQCVAFFMGGFRDHGVVLGIDDGRSRLKNMSEGDSAQYTASGAFIKLREETKNLEALVNKVKIQNESEEFVTVLSDLLEFLIDARTLTLLGWQPLFDSTATQTLLELKTRFDTFKE